MYKHKNVFLITLILIITFFAFSPTLKNNFVHWDDYAYIVDNPAIKSFSPENIKTIFTTFFVKSYHPLAMLSYSLDYYFCKLAPFGYHRTNLVLHLLNCALVFWLIFSLTGKSSVSFITSVLFALHPLRVESVAWIGERKDVLYALFFLGALICYRYYLMKGSLFKYYYAAVFLFLLSLLSKSMAVTLPLVLVLVDYLLERKRDKSIFMDKIPFFMLSIIFAAVAMSAQQVGKCFWYNLPFALLARTAAACYNIVCYLSKTFVPLDLSCLYSAPKTISTCYILLIPILILLLVVCRFYKTIIFGIAFFLITILPVLHIVPIAGASINADRYTYIPCIGLFFAAGDVISRLYKKNTKYSLTILTGLIISLALLTYNRCKIWEDDFNLWNDALQKRQYSNIAYNNRGVSYFDRGELNQAISDFDNTLASNPSDTTALNNRALAYAKKGDFKRSMADSNKSICLNPKNSESYYIRGVVNMLRDQPELAIIDFNRSLEINPCHINALLKRTAVYFYKKEYAKSWDDLRKIESLGAGERIDPSFREDVKKMCAIF